MPRRPAPKPSPGIQKLALLRSGVPREDWPPDIAALWDQREGIQAAWWGQLKALSASELRILANAALMQTMELERELQEKSAEIARRDRLRTRRGEAAQSPPVTAFKAVVKAEWEHARNPEKPRVVSDFARRMVARKGAPITDPRTVLRWCRQWEKERNLAMQRPRHRGYSRSGPCKDVFAQVGLWRDAVCDPGEADDWDGV